MFDQKLGQNLTPPPASPPASQPQRPLPPVPPSPFLKPAPPQGLRPVPPKPVSTAPAVEDMFGDTDKGFVPPRLGQQQPGRTTPPFAPPAQRRPGGENYNSEIFGGRRINWKRFLPLIIVGVILVAVIIVLAVVLARPPANPVKPVNTNKPATTTVNTNTDINQNIPPANIDVPVVEPTTTVPEIPADSDGDGLTDDEEKNLGTDPNKADTDGDGLTDRAETQVYKTDPINPDTDGDSYEDGAEVINNFDPTKPGNVRLFSVPLE